MTGLVVACALAAIALPFAVYPALLWLRATFFADPIREGDALPRVDLVVCAHDEAASIGARIENALALDYPRDRLLVWIASDGSSDGTVEIARRHADPRVRVLDLPRTGKAAALATAVAAGEAEIVAFSDANSSWPRDALRALVRPFSDPRVGGVAGDQRYAKRAPVGKDDPDDSAHGERAYWSFDRRLKHWQSRAGNAISATGAIYAIRRTLFRAPPPDATDDFMVSTEVIARGKRLAFAPDAIALEPPSKSQRGEFRRKVRIISRGLRAVAYRRALLSPSQTGLYAFELFVHKLWRRLAWIPAAVLVLAAPACWSAGGALRLFGLAVVGGFVAGLAGLAFPALARFRPIGVAAYVVMVNAACAVATFNLLAGRSVSRWEPERAKLGAAEQAG